MNIVDRRGLSVGQDHQVCDDDRLIDDPAYRYLSDMFNRDGVFSGAFIRSSNEFDFVEMDGITQSRINKTTERG